MTHVEFLGKLIICLCLNLHMCKKGIKIVLASLDCCGDERRQYVVNAENSSGPIVRAT